MESTQRPADASLRDHDYFRKRHNEKGADMDEDSAMRRMVTDGEELLRKTANVSVEGFAATRDKFQSGLEEMKARLGEARSVLRDKTIAVTEATEDYVDANPWRSLAVAASVGALIGYLVGRRR